MLEKPSSFPENFHVTGSMKVYLADDYYNGEPSSPCRLSQMVRPQSCDVFLDNFATVVKPVSYKALLMGISMKRGIIHLPHGRGSPPSCMDFQTNLSTLFNPPYLNRGKSRGLLTSKSSLWLEAISSSMVSNPAGFSAKRWVSNGQKSDHGGFVSEEHVYRNLRRRPSSFFGKDTSQLHELKSRFRTMTDLGEGFSLFGNWRLILTLISQSSLSDRPLT